MQQLNNLGAKQYEMAFYQFTVVQGQASYVFPAQYLAPFTTTHRRAGVDIPVLNISRWGLRGHSEQGGCRRHQ